MRLWYLSHKRPAKAQESLRIRAVSPEPSLFTHIDEQSDRKSDIYIASPTGCAVEEGATACTFTEDEKYHNPMTWSKRVTPSKVNMNFQTSDFGAYVC